MKTNQAKAHVTIQLKNHDKGAPDATLTRPAYDYARTVALMQQCGYQVTVCKQCGCDCSNPDRAYHDAGCMCDQVITIGCGKSIRLIGTNGGMMPCGGEVISLSGVRSRHFCDKCEEGGK